MGYAMIKQFMLMDYATGEPIGPATPEQIAASDDNWYGNENGIFLIDREGNAVDANTWEAQQPGVRKVYVEWGTPYHQKAKCTCPICTHQRRWNPVM